MSYPYSLDLAFNSEKATADPLGRLSFSSSSGGGHNIPDIPIPDSSYLVDHFISISDEILVVEGNKYLWTPSDSVTPETIIGCLVAEYTSSAGAGISWVGYDYSDGTFIFSKSEVDSLIGEDARALGYLPTT